MVDTWNIQSARILLLWWCLDGDMHKNMEGKFIINFHSHVMHVIWWHQSLTFGFLFCLTTGTLTLQGQSKKIMMFSTIHGQLWMNWSYMLITWLMFYIHSFWGYFQNLEGTPNISMNIRKVWGNWGHTFYNNEDHRKLQYPSSWWWGFHV